MGDVGDYWREHREYKRSVEYRDRKEQNTQSAIRVLSDSGIPYDILDSTKDHRPRHIRIGEYDFWPDTGYFKNIKTERRGRGVRNLIREIKNAKGKQ